MGCGPSTEAEPLSYDPPSERQKTATTKEQLKLSAYQLPSGGFASRESPLFAEYLELLQPGEPAKPEGAITADDALLVIDMQRDFVPKSAANPDGGRFGAPEGDHIVLPIVQLIEHFAHAGAMVAATRDYHPHDHVSFISHGGPFPSHCVQGTPGSKFLPPIAEALAKARHEIGDRAMVAFKGSVPGGVTAS